MLVLLGASLIALLGSGLLATTSFFVAQNIAKYFMQDMHFEDVSITVRDIIKGDHLIVPGTVGTGIKDKKNSALYWHHGVYLGQRNGKDMITDFGSDNLENPVIRPLDDFLGKLGAKMLRRRNYKSGNLASFQEIEELAVKISASKKWSHYNLLNNNCEHYATLLKLGIFYSDQALNAPQDPFYRAFWMKTPEKHGRYILDQYKTINLSPAKLDKPALPFTQVFSVNTSNAYFIEVTGSISPNPREFAITIINNGNFLLYINPRWTEQETVFNDKSLKKGWGKEYRATTPSLIAGQDFKVDILIEKEKFLVIFNGKQFFTFQQEIPQSGNILGVLIDKVNRNDVTLKDVTISKLENY